MQEMTVFDSSDLPDCEVVWSDIGYFEVVLDGRVIERGWSQSDLRRFYEELLDPTLEYVSVLSALEKEI